MVYIPNGIDPALQPALPREAVRQETATPLAASQSVEVQLVEDLADVKQLRPLDKPLPELVNEVAGEMGFGRRSLSTRETVE